MSTRPMTTRAHLTRLIAAELFKLRTTRAWWLFGTAIVVSTLANLVVTAVDAYSLLQPFDRFVALQTHGHGSTVPADFLAHLRDEWTAGHSAIGQAAGLYTAGQLIGVLLVCLLGIVLVTSEFAQQTATSTFLQTPRRGRVLAAKLVTALAVAALAWVVSTVLSVGAGALFLHSQGVATGLASWAVDRAVVVELAAYLLWALLGVGFGALVRHQLAATVSATVLYLIGAAGAGTVFTLVYTYLVPHAWVLAAQVVVPAVASQVMVSSTAAFDHSPTAWVGALVLIAWGVGLAVTGRRTLLRRDIG